MSRMEVNLFFCCGEGKEKRRMGREGKERRVLLF